ncbi:hypothetical protein PHMEG_0004025 [Phytophthora megakarya]|uniref:Uncharacterized protein n=1 Tax=Phytophthora megakarya TaxID=4795 RepID=A0A225WUU5_9STRA|nr:hypothetical protein PHMEG_0004025 [Phytophthora megakarya]
MRHQMTNETDASAIQYILSAPSQIWNMIREEFTWGGAIIRSLTREQVINEVYRSKHRHFGGSIYDQVKAPLLSLPRDGTNSYASTSPRFGMGPPIVDSLTHLRRRLPVCGRYIFVCPRLFLSVCRRYGVCPHVERFVPGLVHCFQYVQMITGMAMQPGSIGCAYDRAVINAVRDQFTDSTIAAVCVILYKRFVVG